MQLISEIMSYDAAYVAPADTIRQAQQTMDEWNIHAVPVCEGAHLIGILSRQDLGGELAQTELLNRPVAEFMTREVICCFDDQSVDDALHQMSSHRIRHIPILNRNRQLIGIVSLTDVANRVSGLPREQAQELLRTFGAEQLSSKEMRTHRLASSSAQGKF
jgi:CBS domain-containing protein